jgi:hypothetical protein
MKLKPYALVVLDIRMPEMDGIRALEELRKIDPLVSVIMLTGYGTLHTAQQAMVAGANQYLRKPPDIAELLDAARKQAAATRGAPAPGQAQPRGAGDERRAQARNRPEGTADLAGAGLGRAGARPEQPADGGDRLRDAAGGGGAGGGAQVDPERGRRLLEYANLVEKAAEYCHHLSENWRQASKQAAEFAPLDLVSVAREVQQVVFFGSVAIQFTGLEQARIRGSKFELMRVFQNIFKNSLEAGATQLTVCDGARTATRSR